MSLDADYERYRRARDAAAEVAEGGEPARDALRTARFELHMWGNPDTQKPVIDELVAAFGSLYDVQGRSTPQGMKTIFTWDVEDPSIAGAAARNLSVTAAAESRHDAYLVWYALTGFPMTYEPGK